jgi:trigger factor
MLAHEVTKISELERKVSVTIPSKDIDDEVKKQLQEHAGKAKIKGFRKGKVPMDILKRELEPQLKADVVGNFIHKTLVDTLTKEDITPVSRPQIQIEPTKPEEPFRYTATFEIYPEVNLVDFTQLTVDKPTATITDQDVTDELDTLLKYYAKWNDVTDATKAAQKGNGVVFDLKITLKKADGTEETNDVADFFLELGAPKNSQDFEKPLYGCKVGDELNFTVFLPQDFMFAEAAGKESKCFAKIKKVMEMELPKVDEEFIKRIGITENPTVENLRSLLRRRLEANLANVIRMYFEDNISEALAVAHTIPLPKTLIDAEVNHKEAEIKQRLEQSYGIKNAPEISRQSLEDSAKRGVKLGLIFSTIADKNNITLDEKKFEAKIQETASRTPNPIEFLKAFYKNPQRFDFLKGKMLEEELFAYIIAKIKTVDKPVTYKEVLQHIEKRQQG